MLTTLCHLFGEPAKKRRIYVLEGPSGHGKSFLCGEVMRQLAERPGDGRTFVKVRTSTQERTIDYSSAYLLEIAAAVARKHAVAANELSPITFLKSRNDETSQRVAAAFAEMPAAVATRAVPWSQASLSFEEQLSVAEDYLRHALRRRCHVLNIENAQAIDRISVLALRKALIEAECGYLLLEYTTDAQWAEWSPRELCDYLSSEGGMEITIDHLPPVTEQEAIDILNFKLTDHKAGVLAKYGAQNLRVGDTVISSFLSGDWVLFRKFLDADPKIYLDTLRPAQKQILALFALYGSAIDQSRLFDLIRSLGARREADLVLQGDLDQLVALGLLRSFTASHTPHYAMVHDFDRLTALRSDVFAEARSEAVRALSEMLQPQKEKWLQDVGLQRGGRGFAAIWGGAWYMLAAIGAWSDLRASVEQVLAHQGAAALPEVVTELRRLIVILKSYPDDGSDVLRSLRADLGWRVVLNLYNTQKFDEAATIAEGLPEDGPLAMLLNCLLDAAHRSTQRGLERIAIALTKLDSNDFGLPDAPRTSMEFLLQTAKVHASLERWDLEAYNKAYHRLWAQKSEFEECPGYSSFLRLTRSELKIAGVTIEKDELQARFREAIRRADDHGDPYERAACRITFSQELGDMADSADDLPLLDAADRLLVESEGITRNIAFDTHSILNNRAAIALVRHGLEDAPALPPETLKDATDLLRTAARDCGYDYGIFMILSNLALAQAFAGIFGPLSDIDRRVAMIHVRRGIEDGDMRRLGCLNTGFAMTLCPPTAALPDPKARARFYLEALIAEGASSDDEWRISVEHLEDAIDAPPARPLVRLHYRPTLMAFWHPTVDIRLPWGTGGRLRTLGA